LLENQLREAQKMEAVGTLAGGIAHDFNNLLQVIVGYAELLTIDKDGRLQGSMEIRAIRQAAERGADLVKRILTFSRRVESHFAPVNLNEEVRQTERLLYRTLPKMISIELRLEDGLDRIRADTPQIEQLLLNLAINAKDAMPEGGTLIFETRNIRLDDHVSESHLKLEPGEYVLLQVSDTGHGMEQDVLEHIFEPFFTTKKPGEGTGLGLSMVYGIVKIHGGHISCRSEPGKGTTFEIYFAAEKGAARGRETEARPIPAGGPETILVVDDEELIGELVEKLLEGAGYKVIRAANGQDAVDIYRKEKVSIDLVVLDMIMPGMSGKKCLEHLLEIDPQAKVVIASGFSVDYETRQFLSKAAKAVVTKPFNMRELLGSVRSVLDGI